MFVALECMLKRCFIAEYEFGLNLIFVGVCPELLVTVILYNNFRLMMYFHYTNNMFVCGSN